MSDATAKAGKPAALTPDLCVIGAGDRGLALATAAAAFGVPVVLVEREATGGRHTALAAKALIEAAASAQQIREAGRLGLQAAAPRVQGAQLHDHIQRALAVTAANQRPERLAALGIRVIQGEAHFTGRGSVKVGDITIRARRFAIATGSRPEFPELSGLAALDPSQVLSEDDLPRLTRLPGQLAVLGGNGRAVALAQAFARLGSIVALICPATLLPEHDAEAVMTLRQRLLREGVALHEESAVAHVESQRSGLSLTVTGVAGDNTVDASLILAAGHRKPDIATLDLDLAGIRSDAAGITVDKRLRTSNRRIHALGSCAGGAAAGSWERAGDDHVGIVLRSVLFCRSNALDPTGNPRIVWSRPEIASIGDTGQEARPGRIRVLRWPFAEVPAAAAAGRTEGYVQAVTDRKGRLLGVTIVGDGAGELIAPWCVALKAGLGITEVAEVAFPALARSDASRRAALSPGIRRLIGFLRRFG
ncbi:MAG: FAD-dependent oxidoreductase [Bosea sp. (in: a-proteobacteria)]|nr:FAD-dependent oxidoreductase [Bosea sp. (in: a-proteobacteria)]